MIYEIISQKPIEEIKEELTEHVNSVFVTHLFRLYLDLSSLFSEF